jgi:hypothetical protein
VQLGGEQVTIIQPVEYRFATSAGRSPARAESDTAAGVDAASSLLVIPAESDNRTREISVEITHNTRHSTKGEVKLLVPQGWQATTASRIRIQPPGEHATPLSSVGRPRQGRQRAAQGVATLMSRIQHGYTAVAYPHVETHFIYHPAVKGGGL